MTWGEAFTLVVLALVGLAAAFAVIIGAVWLLDYLSGVSVLLAWCFGIAFFLALMTVLVKAAFS